MGSQYVTTRLYHVKTLGYSSVMVVLLGLSFLLGMFLFVAGDNMDPIYHCSNKHPQQSMNLDQILGMWYAIEVVHHREDTKQPKGTSVVDTCPVLYLSKTDHKLSLLWQENAGEIEYKFHIPDVNNHPGFWLSSGAQNGTLLNRPYRQFAGTVEVTKAVGTHMVLTFCTPGTELYSVVMSRSKSLPLFELRGINRMLEHRELVRVSVREACRDSASLVLPSLTFIITLLLLHFKKD